MVVAQNMVMITKGLQVAQTLFSIKEAKKTPKLKL
jgi:hypothetical protein